LYNLLLFTSASILKNLEEMFDFIPNVFDFQ
jgi:hypothetical protein